MKFLTAISCIALFISSAFLGSEKIASGDLYRKLSTLLLQNGFDGRIEEKLEQKPGRKLNKDKISPERLVFFDKGLGLHQDNSCAGCHSPGNGFGDSQPLAKGVDNNDIVGPHRDGPGNQRRTPEANAPLNKYAMGQKNALSDAEKRGAIIFFTKGKCVSCEAVNGNFNQMFSDFISHNAGIPQIYPLFGAGTGNVPFSDLACPYKTVTGTLDYGLEEFTGNSNDRYKFRSSPLRNLKVQAAFFYNGSFRKLKDALDFHLNPSVKIATYNPYLFGVPQDRKYKTSDMIDVMNILDPVLKQGISLSKNEIDDLLIFLTESLYDRRVLPENLRKEIPKKVPSGIPPQYFETDKESSNTLLTDNTIPAINYNLYPNPVINQLSIENNNLSGTTKVEVINTRGNIEFVQLINSAHRIVNLPMQKLRTGIYFIHITNKDKVVTIKQIMKD